MAEDAPVKTAPRVPLKQASDPHAPPRHHDDDRNGPAAAADRKAAPNHYGFDPEHWPGP
ncbi:hypothetical protein [Pseudarthrobacter sulfonivorans]|uniref:hypothetical protein n=1 Tax=Pseudarthrobacter sulfonivorans TaxID=121292 RepID=UPI000B1E1714|nr:hypothetical protein [Pseudarthrobacter sulfonivorans]